MTTKDVLSHSPFLLDYKEKLAEVIDAVRMEEVSRAIGMIEAARQKDRAVFVCGNGGSAATASHFVCDMVKGASYNRELRFRIMALTDGTPTLTAYSNDVGYECIFAEQLKNFARAGDLLICISGSGNSPNILSAMRYASSIGCQTIAMTGRDGGQLGAMADLEIRMASPHMGRIEDGHMIVCHMIAYYFMEQSVA